MNSITKITKQAASRVGWQTCSKMFSTGAVCRHSEPGNAAKAEEPKVEEPKEKKTKSERIVEFRNKLRAKVPMGKLDELSKHPFQEVEPLRPWPNNTNPHTGEIGGPAGPEPTRYGDWERKGRVSDF